MILQKKIGLVSNTNMVANEEILQEIVAKVVIKNKMIPVAGQMFIEFENELDNSNQKNKGVGGYTGDKKKLKVIYWTKFLEIT